MTVITISLQDTLPEEAGQTNPLLPSAATTDGDSTSPASKVRCSLQLQTSRVQLQPPRVHTCLTLLLLQVDVRWNMIACGKTRPSLDMTEHARAYLSGIKPRSLNL